MEGKLCIVTGGAGFIGRWLVGKLARLGADVIVIDSLYRCGVNNNILFNTMVQQLRSQGLTAPVLVYSSVQDFRNSRFNYIYERFCSKRPVYAVYHLAAAMGNILSHIGNHLPMLHQNASLGISVCDLMEELSQLNKNLGYPPPKLVFSSTVCIYPHDPPFPTPESAGRICDPEPSNRGYGIGKWVEEQLFTYLMNERDIPVRIARFSNAYGVGDYFLDRPHVIPALIHKCFTEDELHVLGHGQQRRTFVPASDLCDAIIAIGEQDESRFIDRDEPDWFIVNVGTKTDHSIQEVAETVLAVTGLTKKIVYHPEAEVGHERRLVCTKRLDALLEPPYKVEDRFVQTIEEMVEDYKKRREDKLLT